MNNVLLSFLLSSLGQFGGGFGGGMPVPVYGHNQGAGSLAVDTLAVVHCLYEGGRIGEGEARALIDQQGRRRGWPSGWERSIDPRRVGQAIGASGGCRSLMARLDRSGSRITSLPVPVAPWPGTAQRQPGMSPGQPLSPSEREGFGLAPYR